MNEWEPSTPDRLTRWPLRRIAQRDQLPRRILRRAKGTFGILTDNGQYFSAADPLHDQALILHCHHPISFAENFRFGIHNDSLDAPYPQRDDPSFHSRTCNNPSDYRSGLSLEVLPPVRLRSRKKTIPIRPSASQAE